MIGEKTRQVLKQWTTGLSGQSVFVLVVSTVLIILFHENGSSSFFRVHFMKYFGPSSYRGLYPAFYWYLSCFVILGLIPFFLGRVCLGMGARDMGVGFGDWRFGLKAVVFLFLIFLPILVGVSFMPSFHAKYPLFAEARLSPEHFIIYQLAYVVYFIGWEFIFRGFMLFGLRPKLGYHAVFIQMIPFALLHFGKPQIETLAAVFAGVLLGYLALRARSFWYGWLLHALVAVSNDLLAIMHKSWF